jgi:hypothetical protein
MRAFTRSHWVRITALALAGAVNLLFLSLWLISRVHVPAAAVATAMIWITVPLPPQTTVKPRLEPKSRAPGIERRPAAAIDSPALRPSTAITVPPDWYAEGVRSAHAFTDDPRGKPNPLDSKPQVLVLPDTSNLAHKAGDTEHFEGGEVITWINERCYYTQLPSAVYFGGTSQRVCKKRSMNERHSESLAAELEQAVTPVYLRKSLPPALGSDAEASRH